MFVEIRPLVRGFFVQKMVIVITSYANVIISQHTARSLIDCVELIEEFEEGYCQVVLVFDADFGVSLFVRSANVTLDQVKELFKL